MNVRQFVAKNGECRRIPATVAEFEREMYTGYLADKNCIPTSSSHRRFADLVIPIKCVAVFVEAWGGFTPAWNEWPPNEV